MSRNEESVSGDGSTEFYTRNARTLLAHTFTEYGIKDWIDSPCGDCNWQPRIEGFANVSYLGLDIVPGVPLWHDNATVGSYCWFLARCTHPGDSAVALQK